MIISTDCRQSVLLFFLLKRIIALFSVLKYLKLLQKVFLHPKSMKIAVFGCKKNGSSDASIKKRTPLFVVNYTQKWWMRHLFHMNITFGNFGQHSKYRDFLARFWPIPFYKMPKSKPYAALGQFLGLKI